MIIISQNNLVMDYYTSMFTIYNITTSLRMEVSVLRKGNSAPEVWLGVYRELREQYPLVCQVLHRGTGTTNELGHFVNECKAIINNHKPNPKKG